MIRRISYHLLGAVIATLLGVLWLLWRGPEPVVQGVRALEASAPFWYMIIAFPFFGVLLAESWLTWPTAAGRALLAQTAIVFVIAALRLVLHIPVSGHALLLGFFLLWSMNRLDQPYLTEFLLGVGALALILYAKVFLWQDVMTTALGMALSFVVWMIGPSLTGLFEHRGRG